MASHKNLVEIEGNLVDKPEVRTVGEGHKVSTIRIASDDYYLGKSSEDWQKATTYVSVEVWGELAEKVALMEKGALVNVKGKLAESRWEDAESKHHSMLFLRGNTVEAIQRTRERADASAER